VTEGCPSLERPSPGIDDPAALFDAYRNWGRWGDDDQRGTLNYVTEQRRQEAAGEVRLGRVVTVARTIDTEGGPHNLRPVRHRMHFYGPDPISSGDSLLFDIHGMATTHSDALGHEFWRGQGYGGRSRDDIVTGGGLIFGDCAHQAEGLFTRGVLLDVCAAADVPWVSPGGAITRADLELAERAVGVTVRSGDAVLVHSGADRRRDAGVQEADGVRAGLSADCLGFLHEREAAAFSGDCIEQLPSGIPELPFPLHQIGIAAMGLFLVDSVRLDQLAEICAQLGRYTFLFVAVPLPVPGGTGSPVNPICVF
jgi:kynurenine formamidase